MEQGGIELLQVLAKKYIWWKAADDPSLSARRVIVQIMNVGDFNDVRAALDMLGPQSFEDGFATLNQAGSRRSRGHTGIIAVGSHPTIKLRPHYRNATCRRDEIPTSLRDPARRAEDDLAGLGGRKGGIRPLWRHGSRAAFRPPAIGRFRFFQ